METKIKERPILFSGAMVRALLNGSKTQTRRIIKVQPPSEHYRISTLLSTTGDRRNEGRHFWGRYASNSYTLDERTEGYFPCPYGQPGDRLWVRETFNWVDFGWEENEYGYVYKESENGRDWEQNQEGWKWKPSIFMPRAASRLLLEITAVRVERVQDISEADAVAEGILPYHFYPSNACERASVQPPKGDGEKMQLGWANYMYPTRNGRYLPAVGSYSSLWEKINGPESWAANPWVWVVEFKIIEPAATPTIQEGGQS